MAPGRAAPDRPRPGAAARRRWGYRLRPIGPKTAIATAAGLAVSCALLVSLAGRTAKAAVAFAVLAVFLGYLLAPLAHYLRRFALRRRRRLTPFWALVIIYAAGGAFTLVARILGGGRVLGQVSRWSASVPSHVNVALELTGSFDRWQRWFGWSDTSTSRAGGVAMALSDWVRLHVAVVLTDALDYRWVAPWLLLVPVLSFFLLTQFSTFRRSTLRVLPKGHLRWRGHEFLEQVNGVLAGYVQAQVISAVVVAVICCAGLALIGVPYAWLVGAATGVLEFIPLLGPVAAALLISGLVQGPTLVAALVFLLAVRVFQDAVVYPRLMGRSTHLPPLAVLGAVWAGATIGGILGVLLAVPVVAVGAVTLRHVRDYRAIRQLLRANHAIGGAIPPSTPQSPGSS